MATFDRNQIKEWITSVEDDTAEFIGYQSVAARIIGFISSQQAMGELSDAQAEQLLNDAYHLKDLAELGHKYVKLARKPSPEMETMILADHQRERR